MAASGMTRVATRARQLVAFHAHMTCLAPSRACHLSKTACRAVSALQYPTHEAYLTHLVCRSAGCRKRTSGEGRGIMSEIGGVGQSRGSARRRYWFLERTYGDVSPLALSVLILGPHSHEILLRHARTRRVNPPPARSLALPNMLGPAKAGARKIAGRGLTACSSKPTMNFL